MRHATLLGLFAAAIVAGCAGADGYQRNVYEGLKIREAILNPSADRPMNQQGLSYDQYETERKKLSPDPVR
jgi:hypothetical protein